MGADGSRCSIESNSTQLDLPWSTREHNIMHGSAGCMHAAVTALSSWTKTPKCLLCAARYGRAGLQFKLRHCKACMFWSFLSTDCIVMHCSDCMWLFEVEEASKAGGPCSSSSCLNHVARPCGSLCTAVAQKLAHRVVGYVELLRVCLCVTRCTSGTRPRDRGTTAIE